MLMPLHAAAEILAERIRRSGYVEIVAHHDADGIAAGSILAHAMARAGIRFRIRARGTLSASDLTGDSPYLLCDIGAGIGDLPEDTMVVDHHQPVFQGRYHVNPRLAGIDGDFALSASGAAYIVALKLGDNRDLAGLAMLGIIGDGQALSGLNLEIFNDGVANGIITVGRGIRLAGRNLPEKLLTATGPVLDGISGDERAVLALAGTADAGGKYDVKRVLSSCVITAARSHNAGCIEAIFGDTYSLDREVISDAHSFAAVIDACGKTGNGDIGASLCLRSPCDIETAWQTARKHRLAVIAAIRSMAGSAIADGIYETGDSVIASDVADELFCRGIPAKPVAVIAQSGSSCRVSARCPEGSREELGTVIRRIAQDCGGTGGGHRCRAGATIPCDQLENFKKGWTAAVVAG